jgi:GNAT superfamily N-acetyltransferase
MTLPKRRENQLLRHTQNDYRRTHNRFVAKIDSEIEALYARIETAKPHLNHENYAYLGFMYTDPRHRGKALTLFIEALKEWCRSQNITELRLDVYHDNLRYQSL